MINDYYLQDQTIYSVMRDLLVNFRVKSNTTCANLFNAFWDNNYIAPNEQISVKIAGEKGTIVTISNREVINELAKQKANRLWHKLVVNAKINYNNLIDQTEYNQLYDQLAKLAD